MNEPTPDNSPPKPPQSSDRVRPDRFLSWPYVDRRIQPDRRSKATSFWAGIFTAARRRRGRRRHERENIYVDLYHHRELAMVILILFLNILDAYFTLDYVGTKNGHEANPIADQLLRWGNDYFIWAKCLVVALSLVFLLVHKTFRYVNLALWTLLAFYGALFFYHLYLQIEFHATRSS